MTIRFGSIRLNAVPWKHPSGRDYWRITYHDPRIGRARSVTRAKEEDIKAEGLAIAKRLHRGRIDLDDLPEPTIRNLRRLLEVDPRLSLVDEFLAWRSAHRSTITLGDAIAEMIHSKEENRGRSTRNVASLRSDLGNLRAFFPADTPLVSLKVADLERWMASHAGKSAKRRANLRGSAVTLFRWARRRQYLPHELTAAEALERPKVTRKIPPTYTPDEMRLMLDACPDEYRPWLVLSGFQGLRFEELHPPFKSGKSPFAFEDIHRDRRIIIVRPETSKLGDRRVIPIQPGLLEWIPEGSGRITPARPVHKHVDGGSVTARLGALVGGWRPNALRNSFISYRAAQVGLAQTAMEAGNSESEARRSYNDAKSREEADAWFGLLVK